MLGSDGSGAEVRPPRSLLVAALVTAGIAVALIPVGSFGANISGYVTGALLPVGLVAVFAQIDARRRTSPHYRSAQGMRVMSAVALALGISAAAVHAVYFAVELASR